MSENSAFELVTDETVAEINSRARLYRHRKTGAEVLSLANDDENKVFGVTFKTPPTDSTGVAHILEHSVLCGSRRYPVKEPFVEMLKGSLHTFLNAMTFPDKTAYPVASQNLRDFYNLIDVYLDAVFFPLLSENTFRQEGWHYELEASQGPLTYKGVVFNEMKGAYSSPAAVLGKVSQLSLYPDTAYGVNSGGDPAAIPDLSYEQFRNFHARYYHPSNARIVFYGDDDPAERLTLLDTFLGQFDRIDVTAHVALQPRFSAPKKLSRTYAASLEEAGGKAAMVTLNWMLDPVPDPVTALALSVLEHILVGNSAAPLRKALTDSGLGEGLTGSGLVEDLRQPMFTVGLKGIDAGNADAVEALILQTLKTLGTRGIAPETVEAALNSFEFALRENNTGSFPRGIALMFRAMRTWLHGGDPLEPLRFEVPLATLKERLASGEQVFENLIETHLNANLHRTTVLLTPDAAQGAREAAEERARLDAARAKMRPEELDEVRETMEKLKALQAASDAPEALAKIPTLTLADLPRENKTIPSVTHELAGVRVLHHDLPTAGIVYLDIGFDFHGLPPDLLPYFPTFSRALLQTGTKDDDFVALSQRIGRSTGGIGAQNLISATFDGPETAAWFFLRAKAVPEKTGDLLAILTDVIATARLDNKDRIRQMVLESKAGFEGRLAGMGNRLAGMRVRAGLSEADWAGEQMGGITHLFFLRRLASEIDNDWAGVQAKLEAIRTILVNRTGMIANVTCDADQWQAFAPALETFLARLPKAGATRADWAFEPGAAAEGLTFPGQVNFVGKGANIMALGFVPTGATAVAVRRLNTSYLWDRVRVQGGAYGAGSGFSELTGNFVFTSYRDPNLLGTIAAYDEASAFLDRAVDDAELARAIIGVIGAIDAYQLPDGKGFTSLMQTLIGDTSAHRQKRRDEVLAASVADFRALGAALAKAAAIGRVAVLGSETAIKAANEEREGFLQVTRVL